MDIQGSPSASSQFLPKDGPQLPYCAYKLPNRPIFFAWSVAMRHATLESSSEPASLPFSRLIASPVRIPVIYMVVVPARARSPILPTLRAAGEEDEDHAEK